MNMNMSAMTAFLDIGCGLPASPCRESDRASLSACDIPLEEYRNLVISFHAAPDPRAALGRFIAPRTEPQPELIRLLTRLKYKYCLQIAVIGSGFSGFSHSGARKANLTKTVDYYLAVNGIEASARFGILGIDHVDYLSTRAKLESFGLLDA